MGIMNFAEAGRELSRLLVFEQIRRQGRTSRAEIAQVTSLSKATVSAVVSDFLEVGLVQEIGQARTAVGRPRTLLQIVPDAYLAIGAEVDVDVCRVVLANLGGQPLARQVGPLENSTPEEALRRLQSLVEEITEGVDTQRILGLGVSIPGVVEPASGRVLRSVVLGWDEEPLGERLLQVFPWKRLGVFSRGYAASWGECWHGAGKGVRNLVYVRVGTGIGIGMVLNGSPYLGKHFNAGEIGHTTVQPEGEPCRCGNRGCLETVASTRALVQRARRLLPEHPADWLSLKVQGQGQRLDWATLVAAAEEGSLLAAEILAEGGRWLGLALSSVVNLLAPEKIIFGGPLTQAWHWVLGPLQRELARRALPTSVARVNIVPSVLKEDAPAIGAASLVLRELTAPAHATAMPPLVSGEPVPFTGGDMPLSIAKAWRAQ